MTVSKTVKTDMFKGVPGNDTYNNDYDQDAFYVYVLDNLRVGVSITDISKCTGVSTRTIGRIRDFFNKMSTDFDWKYAPDGAVALACDTNEHWHYKGWHFYSEVPRFYGLNWDGERCDPSVKCWMHMPLPVGPGESLQLRPGIDETSIQWEMEECDVDEPVQDEQDVSYVVYCTGQMMKITKVGSFGCDHVSINGDHPLFEWANDVLDGEPNNENLAVLYRELTDSNNEFMFELNKLGIHQAGSDLVYRCDEGDVTISNSLSQRIMKAIDEKNVMDVFSYARFAQRLMKNNSNRMLEGLYDFLRASNIKITEDGMVIAFKRVRGDYRDCYSGKFDNSPGATVSVLRNQVDENPDNTCSRGLHVCSWSYLDSYTGEKVVRVLVDPSDFVSFPKEYFKGDRAKARVCKYQVLDDVTDQYIKYSKTDELGI
jgi:hypothetical protein